MSVWNVGGRLKSTSRTQKRQQFPENFGTMGVHNFRRAGHTIHFLSSKALAKMLASGGKTLDRINRRGVRFVFQIKREGAWIGSSCRPQLCRMMANESKSTKDTGTNHTFTKGGSRHTAAAAFTSPNQRLSFGERHGTRSVFSLRMREREKTEILLSGHPA